MIRAAELSDIESILVLGERFFNKTEYSNHAEFSKETTAETLKHLISDDNGILLVLENDGVIVGMVGALLYPFYMTGELTGQELFWWCEDKGKGLSLLTELEQAAKNKGAKTFIMISLNNLAPERLDRLYLKNGYKRAEHTYMRIL